MMQYKLANWPAPPHISALSTTRLTGLSQAPYESNNLGLGIGDNDQQVLQNRQKLATLLGLPGEPQWLQQKHGTDCVLVEEEANRSVDAAISRSSKYPLVILSADCLPIMLCNTQGNEIAAVHAGWRGLAHGIIEKTLKKMNAKPSEILAWIGPSICQKCYEVGEEVYELFATNYPLSQPAFKLVNKKWLPNLSLIAEIILRTQGIQEVYQSKYCTFELKNEFYSYRRNSQTGRIATLIWLHDYYQDKSL